jgi:hypothetical protein
MKSCIIFACTIITNDRIHVLIQFLDSFKSNFADCDIYIGINNVSIPNIETIINSYDLNVISMSRCADELYTLSDASAYQEALKNLVVSGNEYENYWFIHTKGGVNIYSDYLRGWYIDNFINKRESIESFINTNDGIGSYGLLGLEYDIHQDYGDTDCDISLFENKLTNNLPYTHSNFFYIHTLYVINKKPMDIFRKSITNKWFTTKLDRYYFEGAFPFIVSRTGYFPYIENQYSCSGTDLQPYINDWITVNNLIQFKNYSTIFKTNFKFNQLCPPYVNSNT